MTTRQVILAAIPRGMVQESDFALREVEVPALPAGGLLVRTRYLSVDPYLRGLMRGTASYLSPIRRGDPVTSGCVGEVLESGLAGFRPGDFVSGIWAWQEVAAVEGKGLVKVDPAAAPLSTALGILGMPGMTAYFGLLEICAPKPGETVVVSGAAGAVGSAAGQIARILGCRVVGSAGSDEKCDYLRSIGFHAAINYRTDKPYDEVLRRTCPNGIDCYFDNVGGEFTDAVFAQLNPFARVSVCGQIAKYNDMTQDTGPRPFLTIIVKQLRVEGFLVFRWLDRYPEGITKLAQWLREGKLTYRETVYEGLEAAPRAFVGLFRGDNIGKAIVKVS